MTDEELHLALAALADGRVVAAATETFFGFLADARLGRALDALFDLKGRAPAKGVALLIPGREAWAPLVAEVPAMAAQLADRFWPGPLTIALPARAEVDRRLTVEGTVAVRWPGPSDAARIAASFGAPLTATSANRAGEPPWTTSYDVTRMFHDALVEGRLSVVSGRAPGGEASTVVTVVGGRLQVVRSGRIRETDLRG